MRAHCKVAVDERPAVTGGADTYSGRRFTFDIASRDGIKALILDVNTDGRQEWSEQYSGELRWYPFTPSPAERHIVNQWRRMGVIPPAPRGSLV